MPSFTHRPPTGRIRSPGRGNTRSRKRKPGPSAASIATGTRTPDERLKGRLSKSLASAALAFPARTKVGKIVKSAVGGFATGLEIQSSLARYKQEKATKGLKGTKTKGTVSQSAMTQKAQMHKKDPTDTVRT